MGKKLIAFTGLSKPVKFEDCDELILGITDILRGWDLQEVSADSTGRPGIRIRKTKRGYRRVSPWLCLPSLSREKIRRGTVSAICSFHYEFIDWLIAENEGLLCLHCAAVQFGEGLVIFPTVIRSGKSTLSVQLAESGARIFCDDVLPIETKNNDGMAPGILPRLRVPLPRNVSKKFRAFVSERTGPHNKDYLYVNLKDNELAPLGERAPIRGIVMLDRQPDVKAEISPMDKAEVLTEVIMQNFVRERPALDIMERLHSIVDGAACYTMCYSKGEHAVKLLHETFN